MRRDGWNAFCIAFRYLQKKAEEAVKHSLHASFILCEWVSVCVCVCVCVRVCVCVCVCCCDTAVEFPFIKQIWNTFASVLFVHVRFFNYGNFYVPGVDFNSN